MMQAVANSPYVLNECEPFRVRNSKWFVGGALLCFGLLSGTAMVNKLTLTLPVILLFSSVLALAFFAITAEGVARSFRQRQFEYWLNACPVSPHGNGFVIEESAFVNWISACPGSGGTRDFEVFGKIVTVSKHFAIRSSDGEKYLHPPSVRNVLSAIFSNTHISKADADDLGRKILRDLSDWIVSDPKNWAFGREIHSILKTPEFERLSAEKARFPNFAGSIFPPKGVEGFGAVLSFLSLFAGKEGSAGIEEQLVAELFFSLTSTTWCTPMDAETAVRFKRLFLLSQEFWDDEQHEKALEFCLCGHFGSEIAEFAVPYVADVWYADVDPDFGPDEEERGSIGYRLVHSNLSAWVDSAAIPGVKLVLSDLGHPNDFEEDHPAGMPVEMRLEEDELPNPRYWWFGDAEGSAVRRLMRPLVR